MRHKDTVRRAYAEMTTACIDARNRARIESQLDAMRCQDTNLDAALSSLAKARSTIDEKIIALNRGGARGMHGFIAEVAEVGIRNARNSLAGRPADCEWINNNGAVDILRSGVPIQQKFVESGGMYSLDATIKHLHRYPDFIDGEGVYQIPRDHYKTVLKLYLTPRQEAVRTLNRSGGVPSFKDWEHVQAFFRDSGLKMSDIEPSMLTYSEVQPHTIHDTLSENSRELRRQDRRKRQAIRRKHAASVSEGLRVTAGAAAFEGATTLAMIIATKLKEGRRLRDLDQQDWREIITASSSGAVTGAIRGASIYALTNLAATPATAANAFVTTGLGVAEQAYLLRNGSISETEFVESTQLLCLESAVVALSATIGQTIIPIPVLGAVIGGTTGSILSQVVEDGLNARERELAARLFEENRALDAQLESEWRQHLDRLKANMEVFLSLVVEMASVDAVAACEASVALARRLGIPSEDILDTPEKARAYFMD